VFLRYQDFFGLFSSAELSDHDLCYSLSSEQFLGANGRLALSHLQLLCYSGSLWRVIALWIAIDGKRLERYALKIRALEKKLVNVEQKIRNIKPRNKEKE